MRSPFGLLSIVVGSSIEKHLIPPKLLLLREADFRVESSSDEGTLMISLKSGKCNVEFSFPNMVISNSENLLGVIKSQFPIATFRNRNACIRAKRDAKVHKKGNVLIAKALSPTKFTCTEERGHKFPAIVSVETALQMCAKRYWKKELPSDDCTREAREICGSALDIRAAMSEVLSDLSFVRSDSFKLYDNVNVGVSAGTAGGAIEVSIVGKECVTKLRFQNVVKYSTDKIKEFLVEKQWVISSRSGCLNLIHYEYQRFEDRVQFDLVQQTPTLVRLNCGGILGKGKDSEASVNFIGQGGVSLFTPRRIQTGSETLRNSGFCDAALLLRRSIKGAVAEETP